MNKGILTGVAATAFAATLALAAPAAAAVTFDPGTGQGFVGKGDVQLAFSWNNSQLQSNASGLSFTYESETTYDAVCEWVTGEGKKGQKTHTVPQKKKTSLESTVVYEARTKNQITGFTLTGIGSTTTTGTVPTVGGGCIGDGANGTYISVTEVGNGSGGLYVNHNGLGLSSLLQ
ncbi:hypothetical protein [Arthrobacter mobilis]|uniref:Secreted protein n=1 Tax=Arthrobacter mobilis TaxID=2724944 RepID=A0A7X6HFF0_9MICC|nr:hypothetical protein [Arthrobacter mobilis]NKX54692.1 hypothetical protein [Arthrobacter mobilis]